MTIEELSRTLDRGKNNENDFKIILECLVLEISTNRALMDVILNQVAKNGAEYQTKFEEIQKGSDWHREKIIAHLYSAYGYLPPELLGDENPIDEDDIQ